MGEVLRRYWLPLLRSEELEAPAGPETDYGIDRNRQRSVNFSGLEESPPLQDAAVQESMGAIVDRSGEHLGASDAAIVRVRQKLLDAARRLAGEGIEPPGAGEPDAYRLRGCQLVLPRDADWRALSRAEQGG
jgi:phthalate 4,5-dioxygenase